MKPSWLSRRIAAPGPYLTLCTTEAQYIDAMKHMKAKPEGWLRTEYADATMHTLEHPGGGVACIVCIKPTRRDGIEVAGLLVHEAVHIWQRYAARIGEDYPGAEQEAYAIQAIAQELMESYAIQIGARKA